MTWSRMLLVTIAINAMLSHVTTGQGSVGIRVNSSWTRGPFQHFWRSTGFCPPDPHSQADKFDLSNDMQQNLAYIGAVPHGGIQQVRIHFLLSLVRVTGMSGGEPVYDFSKLDTLLDWLHDSGLSPGFEIMGNPSNIFTDFDDTKQVYWWRSLMQQTAQRYLARYGEDYVLDWNWESWNEPNSHDWDSLHVSTQGYLNYYDACSEGLKAAHPGLKLGGPGSGSRKLNGSHNADSLAEALLQHAVNGTNFFTGKRDVRLDFISVHKKGNGSSIAIINETLTTVNYIKQMYPSLAHKPLYNDEADPLAGWNKDEVWRGGQTYAAMVVKIIAQHQNFLKAPGSIVNFSLLSNDNAFLSFYPHQFTQRTLLARFQINNTTPHYTTFIRKSVYGAMCMLSLLGDHWLAVENAVAPSGEAIANDSYFGALATLHDPEVDPSSSDSWQMTVLLYESEDTQHGSKYDELLLNWYIQPPSTAGPLMMAGYFMNDGGPYEMWTGLYNSTPFPTASQFQSLRSIEEPRAPVLYPVKSGPGMVPIPPMFQLLEPDVVVMHLCAQPPRVAEAPVNLRFIPVTAGQVLVVWSDSPIRTKCIHSYELQQSRQSESGPFQRVNHVDSMVTAFLHTASTPGSLRGWYRVRAVDYWQRPGNFSPVTAYTGDGSLHTH